MSELAYKIVPLEPQIENAAPTVIGNGECSGESGNFESEYRPEFISDAILLYDRGGDGGPAIICENVTLSNRFQEAGYRTLLSESGKWKGKESQALHDSDVQEICLYGSPHWLKSTAKALDCATYPPVQMVDDGETDINLIHGRLMSAEPPDWQESEKQTPVYIPKPISLAELMTKNFPPIKWIVPGILPEGLTLIAGPSKLGKSWLTLDIALGVAFGSKVLGEIPVTQGDVLVWALEDSQRRIQSRINMLSPEADFANGTLSFVTVETMPPALDKGGIEQIKKWIGSVENPRLVVIDVLARVAPDKKSGESEYDAIYRGLSEIHALASMLNISIFVVHHTVKGSRAGDPFDKVNGTRAFTALPDATLVMDRDGSGFCDAVLYGRGRDLIEFDHALDYDAGKWSILGDVDTIKRSDERTAILDALKSAPAEGFSPSDICTMTNGVDVNTRNLLSKMCKSGEVRKLGRGRYVIPAER